MLVKCIFREFNKLILPGIKFSVLIRNMAPSPKVSGGHLPQMPHPGSAIETPLYVALTQGKHVTARAAMHDITHHLIMLQNVYLFWVESFTLHEITRKTTSALKILIVSHEFIDDVIAN